MLSLSCHQKKKICFFACIENADLIYYSPMGQQLRTRAKRARRIARNKRAHARLLAAKKK